MEERLNQLFQLPLPHKLAILGGTVVTLFAGFWFLLYSPVFSELTTMQDQIDGAAGLRYQVAQQQGIAKNLDKYVKEVDGLEVELKKALQELPDEKEIDQLLARISDVGRDAGLEIRLFKPRDEQKKDFYAEVPVEMEVYGNYHQLATFFDEVGHMERIVNVDEFNMTEPEVTAEAVNLKTAVVATTFRFLDEKERVQLQEADKQKGRGNRRNRESADKKAATNPKKS